MTIYINGSQLYLGDRTISMKEGNTHILLVV